MKKILAVFLFATLVLACVTVQAAPSINGSTGLINIPTADTLRPGQFSIGFYDIKNNYSSASFNMNLVPHLEVGITAKRYNKGFESSGSPLFNAKLSLADETVLTPGIAVGIEDITAKDDRSYYLAVSKGLIWGVRVHAGVGNGRYNGYFAAIEKTIKPVTITSIGVTSLIAEWDGNHVNYGIRMTVSPGLRIDAGIRKHNGYLGVSFTG